MLKKLQSDDDDLMEIFRQHYAELRREHSEYEDTVHKATLLGLPIGQMSWTVEIHDNRFESHCV